MTVGTDALLLGLSGSAGVGVGVPSHGRVAKTGNNATDRIFDVGWNEHLVSHNPGSDDADEPESSIDKEEISR